MSLSSDNGASWKLVNEGLIDTLVEAIAVSDSFIFAGGSSGSGIWRRLLPEMIGVVRTVEPTALLPSKFNLAQNYPNPFNPATTLRYDLPHRAHVRLVIYDLRGREVSTLVDAHAGPGYRQLSWDGQDRAGRQLPTGIYFARLVTPEITKTIKMVRLK